MYSGVRFPRREAAAGPGVNAVAMKIVSASDSSLLVVFGNEISPELHGRVIALFHALRAWNDPRVRNLHPGFASVLIDFDPLQLSHEELTAKVHAIADAEPKRPVRAPNVVSIPVCYDPEFGPDLADIAAQAKLTVDEVIRLHSSASYLVYFLGFGPGFGYMVGLPRPLHVPRLTTPRSHVAAGSVAIAGNQSAIYPNESPGGWRLLGRTPLRMFRPEASPPTRFQPGDMVRFHPIDRATFDATFERPEQP